MSEPRRRLMESWFDERDPTHPAAYFTDRHGRANMAADGGEVDIDAMTALSRHLVSLAVEDVSETLLEVGLRRPSRSPPIEKRGVGNVLARADAKCRCMKRCHTNAFPSNANPCARIASVQGALSEKMRDGRAAA